MSSIERFYTTTFTAKRLTWSNESAAEVSIDSFSGHIQQASPEFSESIGENWGQTFLVWCNESTDVDPGDTLTVASGAYAGTYTVKNIQTNAVGANQHLELVAIRSQS